MSKERKHKKEYPSAANKQETVDQGKNLEDMENENGDYDASQEGIMLSAEQLAELRESIAKVQGERDEYFDRLQRLQAEFDNYRKRNAALRVESLAEGQRETVTSFLPVVDNMERALVAAELEHTEEDNALLEGVKMIYRQFLDVLQKLGIEEIPAQDEPFDPNFHNAITQGEVCEDHPENTVMEVYQKGYKQGDRVLRHSMVKVSQ